MLKWIALALGGAVVLLVAVAFALQGWANSADFRARAEREAAAALGAPVTLGRISVDLWPLPAVALDDARVQTQPPITVRRVEVRPVWSGLLRGRLEVATLVVRDAVLADKAVSAIALAVQKKRQERAGGAPATAGGGAAVPLPRRALLERVTWIDAKGARTTLDAQARLDDDGLPGSASLKIVQGRLQGAQATLQRAQPQQWTLDAALGGGTIKGPLTLAAQPRGGWKLQGQLTTTDVSLAALTAPSRTLGGQLEASSSLQAEFREIGALAEALHTRTHFTVRNATVHGIDLQQAVLTMGLSRDGQTRLDTLAGDITTQGRTAQLSNLVAQAGALVARGEVAMAANQALSGRITVDLGSKYTGVPLVVGGTLEAPSVMPSRGAMLGAAIGTAVAPGAGTGAGAKLGDKLGRLLGGK